MKIFGTIGIIAVLLLGLSCSGPGNNNKDRNKDTQTRSNVVTTSDNNESKARPIHLTYETFKEKVWDFETNPDQWVYKGEEPCVIDFYADWCQPCKKVAPIMEDLAKKYDGQVTIYKIDTETQRELARVFRIRSIPTILFSPMEGKPMMQSGAFPKETYVKIIEDNLLTKENNI